MIKVLTDLLLLVFNDCVLEFVLIAPPHEMLLLFVLVDDLSTDFALGRIPVALDGVRRQFLETHLQPAVGALDKVVRPLVQQVVPLLLLAAETVVILGCR